MEAAKEWHNAWWSLGNAHPNTPGALLPDNNPARQSIEHILGELIAAYGDAALGNPVPGLPDGAVAEARDHRDLVAGALSELWYGLDRLTQRKRDGKDRSKVLEPLLHELLTGRSEWFERDPISEIFVCLTRGLKLSARTLARRAATEARRHNELPEGGFHAGMQPTARGGRVRSERSKLLLVALNHLEYFEQVLAKGAFSNDRRLDLGLLLLRESAKYPDAFGRMCPPNSANIFPHVLALNMRGLSQDKTLGNWIDWFRSQRPVREFEERLQRCNERGRRTEAAGRDLFTAPRLLDALREQGFFPVWDNINGLDQAVSRAREALLGAFELGPDGGLVLRENLRQGGAP